jgi:glycosyltransferase involved in cell wall biosynthesis
MKKMNIVICAGLGEEFLSLGHRVLVLCHKSPSLAVKDEIGDGSCECRIMNRSATKRVFETLDRFRPDMILTHNVAWSDLTAFRYARLRKIRIFSMVHTRYRHYVQLSIPWKFLRLPIVGIAAERWIIGVLNHADLVFALTEDMKNYLRELGLSRLAVAGNGVDPDLFPPREDPGREPASRREPFRLLFVGQIREMKNQIYLLKMARFLPEGYRLDLVGGRTWDGRYYRKFQKELRSGRYPHVDWQGELPPAVTRRFYGTSHIFVNPSILEGQGLAQIEALVSGLPTVRLYSPRSKGVTAHLQTAIHLEETTSPENFAEAVVRLRRDENLYQALRRSALAERNLYSWRKTAERILAFFTPTES